MDKVVNLDHLTDVEYDNRLNQLEQAMSKTLNIVLANWVKDKVIRDVDRQALIKYWKEEGKYHIFEGVL